MDRTMNENMNVVIHADGTEQFPKDMAEEMNEEEYETGLPSFATNEEDANERETNIDVASIGLDEEFDTELSELKRNLYNATVYGPPVGSQAAQDVQLLEKYEGLLLQLYNLTTGVLAGRQPGTIDPNILAQYPNPTQPLVTAYYERVCDFQRTNRDRQLTDVLKDFLERRLKEQTSPYTREDDGEQ